VCHPFNRRYKYLFFFFLIMVYPWADGYVRVEGSGMGVFFFKFFIRSGGREEGRSGMDLIM
jgi:hypothetical protein